MSMNLRTRLRVAKLMARDSALALQARRCQNRTAKLLEQIQQIRRRAEEQQVIDIGGAKRIEAELLELRALIPDLVRLRNAVIAEVNDLTGSTYPTFPETGA